MQTELIPGTTDLKIFLVDDDVFNLKVTKFHLNRVGYKDVTCFDSGLDCLKELSLKPDIIFLDQYMYGVQGIDVLKKIKQLNPEIIVVMLSAEDNERSIAFFKMAGAHEYIIKGKEAMREIELVLSNVASANGINAA